MDALSAAAFGVVLAATAGLRAVLPVFSASLMAWMTDLPLPDEPMMATKSPCGNCMLTPQSALTTTPPFRW